MNNSAADSNAIDCEKLEDRHDEIREQLELMEGWLESLPATSSADRRRSMEHIVDFLQRYVLVDCAFEEEQIFPRLGDIGLVLRSEHGFIRRWIGELDAVAHAEAAGGAEDEAARFRSVATKLFGVLEMHLHTEDTLVRAILQREATPRARVEVG